MIIFSTRSVQYLASRLHMHHGKAIIKQFSDGELFVRIDEDITEKQVWVIASTILPAENILELLFMLDALTRAGAPKINLIITYFAYARQAVVAPGEAQSPAIIAQALNQYNLNTFIIHAHNSEVMQSLLPFQQLIPIEFFCNQASSYDAVAAPDQGAHIFAQQIAKICDKDLIRLTKTRPEHEKVKIGSVDGDARGKRILLVDDIIATGRTVMSAAQALIDKGALEVAAAATHGIFSLDARLRIDESVLEKVYVTNTIDQTSAGKVDVTDINPLLTNIIRSF